MLHQIALRLLYTVVPSTKETTPYSSKYLVYGTVGVVDLGPRGSTSPI